MNFAASEPESKPATAYEAPSRMSLAIRWFREKMGFRSEGSLKELIEEALEENSAEAADISDEEKSLLKNLIHFGELTVADVMVPRSDIMAVEREASLADLKQHVITIGHTRIPVFHGSLDAIDGFIHVKDLFPHLASDTPFEIARVLREILFVPPSMRIVDLLPKMRVSGCHIAIVVDEFGGTDGLVTMEDLFEELVGEIQDEHDGHDANPGMRWIGDHMVEADARIPLETLQHAFGEPLVEGALAEDIDTLAGLIFSQLGRVPARGEMVHLRPGLKAEILLADPRRIRLVRLIRSALSVG